MNRAVFDTNILIDFARSDSRAQDVIKRCERRCISVVTWIEFLAGIPEPQMDRARQFLDDVFELLVPDDAVYEDALALRRGQAGKRLKLPDAMIYAAARGLGGPLVTRNTKDFDEKLPGIYVPYT